MPAQVRVGSGKTSTPFRRERWPQLFGQNVPFLLLAGTIVGVDIEKSPFENIKVTILNPEALPVILFLLVLYFAFRVTVEWFQCNSYRRSFLASLVDFWAAHILGIAATLIYSIQQAARFRIADFFINLPLVGLIPATVLFAIFVLISTRKMLLRLGSFTSHKALGTHFKLPSATILEKAALCAIFFGLILMPIIFVYNAFFSKLFIFAAIQMGVFLGYLFAVIWVYFFEFWYRQRKIAPGPPTSFTIS
jgi:lipid-A-disaccharide synthase-like uncharacterized protein